MKSNNVASLKIHKLTQKQYDDALAAGKINPTELYLTPDEGDDIDTSSLYITAGQKEGSTLGNRATAEGIQTIASGEAAHAEGGYKPNEVTPGYNDLYTTASGNYSHAEGEGTTASGWASHAEGGSYNEAGAQFGTTASGYAAHAEGVGTTASAYASHAGGYGTYANKVAQTVVGTFNNTDTNALFVVGDGDAFKYDRSNAFEVFGKYATTSSKAEAYIGGFAVPTCASPFTAANVGHFVTVDGNGNLTAVDILVGGSF